MFKHHEDSLQKLIDYFSDNQSVIAIILCGSIAKGLERIDSDIDVGVIVSDKYYVELTNQNKLSECIFGHCTYKRGYFDVKYYTKDFLETAAIRGSEPTRNAFVKSRCVFTRDSEIERIVQKIGLFQEHEKSEKMKSFYSALALNYHYFWKFSKDNMYLHIRSAADIVLFGYRLLLQENHVLFPCHKHLIKTVAATDKKPDNIVQKGECFLKNMDDEPAKDFVDSILGFIQYQPPKDWSEVLTRFIDDNELWWYKERPLIAEW